MCGLCDQAIALPTHRAGPCGFHGGSLANYGLLLLRSARLAKDSMILYHTAYLAVCVLAIVHNPLWQALLLLDIGTAGGRTGPQRAARRPLTSA